MSQSFIKSLFYFLCSVSISFQRVVFRLRTVDPSAFLHEKLAENSHIFSVWGQWKLFCCMSCSFAGASVFRSRGSPLRLLRQHYILSLKTASNLERYDQQFAPVLRPRIVSWSRGRVGSRGSRVVKSARRASYSVSGRVWSLNAAAWHSSALF